MLTKIPRFGCTEKSENATSSSKSTIAETGINKKNQPPEDILKLGYNKTNGVPCNETTNLIRRVQIPRVAFIKQKNLGGSTVPLEKRNQPIVKKNSSELNSKRNIRIKDCVNTKLASSIYNGNTFNVKSKNSDSGNLSFRQKNLIAEREVKLGKSKQKLNKIEEEFNKVELSYMISESELKLQLEYFEDVNQKYQKKKSIIQDFENSYLAEITQLENQLHNIESLLIKYRDDILNIRSSNNELAQKILEADETIGLLSKEVSESEKSIKLYEFSHLNNSKLSDRLNSPFNSSVEFALKLERLLNNDKMTLNQLQFKLHKFKNKPRLVLRSYSIEIPQTSRIFISVPNPERSDTKVSIEDISYIGSETQTHNGNTDANETKIEDTTDKFFIDFEKKLIFLNDGSDLEIDKIVVFDETKRPSSLLLTDLSKIQDYLSNIIEGKNDENSYLDNCLMSNKNIFLRRQSLLCNRIDTGSPQKYVSVNNKQISDVEKSNFYDIDIAEQKEIEVDVLLLVNDIFNSIKLGLDDKVVFGDNLNNKVSQNNPLISPVCFANIGMDNTAARKTFWGTNKSRCVFMDEFQIKEANILYRRETNKLRTPGILHSVIHQIYHNINNSSLVDWNLSSKIIIQKPEYKKSNNNKIRESGSKDTIEKHVEFPGGLKGCISFDSVNSLITFSEDSIPVDAPLKCDNYIHNESYRSKEISYRKHKTPGEFISEIYNEIEKLSPGFLSRIGAYDFRMDEESERQRIGNSVHVIIDLKLKASIGNFSVHSNVILVDLFVNEGNTLDKYVSNYFNYVRGILVNDEFIQYIYNTGSENKNEISIYSLVHSNI